MQLLSNPGLSKGPKTMQDAAVATGNGTSIEVTAPGKGGFAALALQVVIETTATVTFEATIDGTNWVAVMFEDVTTGTEATTATASGIFRANVLGFMDVRARVSAWTAGTVDVTGVLVA